MTNILDIQKNVAKTLEYIPEKEPEVKLAEPQFKDVYGRNVPFKHPMSPKHRKRLARQRKRALKNDQIQKS